MPDTTTAAASVAELSRGLDEEMKRLGLIRRLMELGWVPPHVGAAIKPDALHEALAEYQKFFGLPPTGEADRFTDRSLSCLRICGHPDVLPITAGMSQWPADGRPVTWVIESKFPTLSDAEANDAYNWSMSQWAAVCGIDVRRAANPKTADILVTVQPIDKRAGVLAQSQLPNGTRTLMRQFYDAAEPFVFAEAPSPQELDIGRVMCHENGHVIGIGHLAAGCLLQPLYDLRIRTPQAGDIAEATLRYGPPKPKAADARPDLNFTITLRGRLSETGEIEIPGVTVTKL